MHENECRDEEVNVQPHQGAQVHSSGAVDQPSATDHHEDGQEDLRENGPDEHKEGQEQKTKNASREARVS
jgi:hypothetical protein